MWFCVMMVKRMNFRDAIILGSIYEPELDRRIVLMSVDPRDWAEYEDELERRDEEWR